jgi:hypothetical protein
MPVRGTTGSGKVLPLTKHRRLNRDAILPRRNGKRAHKTMRQPPKPDDEMELHGQVWLRSFFGEICCPKTMTPDSSACGFLLY